jgi:hypothetical protein
MKKLPGLRARWMVAGGVLALALAGGIAYASIPDSGGLIHGCYMKKNGALRVIDSEAGAACNAKKELSLNWNQAGGATGVDDFTGTACVNHTFPGTVAVEYALDGVITLRCVLANNAGLTALAAPASAADTNIKVTGVTGMSAGQAIVVDPGGAAPDTGTIVSIGTPGANGTGVNISPALATPHPNATVVGFQDS